MTKKCYGENRLAYVVSERNRESNGHIEIFVFHENESMRNTIKNASSDPIKLLERYNTYLESSIRAKYWLAQVMKDFWAHFENNLVDFTFVSFK